jgi:hypothetical protein
VYTHTHIHTHTGVHIGVHIFKNKTPKTVTETRGDKRNLTQGSSRSLEERDFIRNEGNTGSNLL